MDVQQNLFVNIKSLATLSCASPNVIVIPSLVARRRQWRKEEEERLARQPDPSIPPGHSLMPAEERRRTLEVLRQRT